MSQQIIQQESPPPQPNIPKTSNAFVAIYGVQSRTRTGQTGNQRSLVRKAATTTSPDKDALKTSQTESVNMKEDSSTPEAGSSVMDVNPYYSNTNKSINSYVKTQNYYQKFFQKKMPSVA